MELSFARTTLRLKAPFRIAGHVFDTSPVVTVTLTDDAHRGRGEAAGVFFLGDDIDHMCAVLDEHRAAIIAVARGRRCGRCCQRAARATR